MSYPHRLLLAALVAGLCPALTACNTITGAADLKISNDEEDDLVGAAGVTIREVALYQGVKRPLMLNGAPAESSIPIIQGRDALIRVFYDTDATLAAGPVTARLSVAGQKEPLEQEIEVLALSSSDADLQSTINFEVPGDWLVPNAAYKVELLQPPDVSAEDNAAARYPAETQEVLNVDATPATLKLVIVPVAYAADGSNRLPDTSDAQIQAYRDLFYALYPLSSVELTVHEPFTWNNVISPSGAGWEEMLDGLASYRAQQGAADNEYYYGIFTPTSSEGEFCGGGCVAGLGFVAMPGDSFGRAAIGIGYTGAISTETAVHEVGHNHGRDHAPCGGPAGVDTSFPYAGGSVGVWGYNIITKQLFDPDLTSDVMGYCTPLWVSDYTFRALHGRVQMLDGAEMRFPPESLDRTYDRVRIDGTGTATFLQPLTLHKPPLAEPTQVELTTESGEETVTGQFYRYDHIEGGVLFWPRPQAALRAAKLHVNGQQIRVQR